MSSPPLDRGGWEADGASEARPRGLPVNNEATPASIRSRRETAAQVRRRRLLVGDLLLGLALGLVGLASAPGPAIVALLAPVVLLACGAWALYARRRGRERVRVRRTVRGRPRGRPRGPRSST